jgi:6-phosphofructokinase
VGKHIVLKLLCYAPDAAGGAVLGTSVFEREEMQGSASQFQRVANKLRYWGIDMLFVIGGEGGIKMAAEMAQWCNKEKVRVLGARVWSHCRVPC